MKTPDKALAPPLDSARATRGSTGRATVLTACALAACSLTACSSDTVARPPAPPVNWQSFDRPSLDAGAAAPTPKESTAAEDYLAALASPSFAQLGRLFEDDARFSFPGMEDAHDRDGVIRAHGALFGAFDQRSFVASRIWRTAGEQTVEWTLSGVQARDWMGVAATQKPITARGVTLLWTNDDGTLADAHVYFDVAAVKALLGAGPKELSGLAAPAVPTAPPQIVDAQALGPDHGAVVKTALDALENGAESAYLEQMAADVDVHTLERAEPVHGKDGQHGYFKTIHKAIAQLDTTVQNEWTVGSFVVVEYSIAGEQLGSIGWVPLQRDHVVKLHMVDIDEVKDGAVTGIWRYDNPSELLVTGP